MPKFGSAGAWLDGRFGTSLMALVAGAALAPSHAAAQAHRQAQPNVKNCRDIAKMKLPDVRIDTAELVEGTFVPPGGGTVSGFGKASGPISGLPPFCRVAATVGKDMRFELWMPVKGWNGRFHGIGIGGMAGAITYSSTIQESLPGLAEALRRGYAVAASDQGHQTDPKDSNGGLWAIGQPQRLKNYFEDGTHLMTIHSKEMVKRFYRRAPTLSSFAGCSGGGRQGLVEANRYPADYDAIVAFAPTNIELAIGFLLRANIAMLENGSTPLSRDQLALTWSTIMDRCDKNDGLIDGSIGDPRRCDFKPVQLECRPGQADTCLTPAQVRALDVYYRPLTDAKGQTYFPGGGENYFMGQSPGNGATPILHTGERVGPFVWGFAQLYSQDPNWHPKQYSASWVESIVAKYSPVSSWTTDLDAFRKRGGKLLLVQGWADWGITPTTTIAFYLKALSREKGRALDEVTATAGDSAFMRLFMAADTDHCGGGQGASHFDALDAVVKWRVTGAPPELLTASRVNASSGAVDRTRPLCPFPLEPRYRGDGDINRAESFECRAPEKSN